MDINSKYPIFVVELNQKINYQKMEITEKTTAKEISDIEDADERERAIIIFAKFKHKQARFAAYDIVIEHCDGENQIEVQTKDGSLLFNEMVVRWQCGTYSPLSKILNIRF